MTGKPNSPSPAKVAGAAAAAAWWLLAGRHKPAAPNAALQAFALLGLGPTATADDVHAAWRRRIADAHPDKGGSADDVARLTEARDVLLKRLSA